MHVPNGKDAPGSGSRFSRTPPPPNQSLLLYTGAFFCGVWAGSTNTAPFPFTYIEKRISPECMKAVPLHRFSVSTHEQKR